MLLCRSVCIWSYHLFLGVPLGLAEGLLKSAYERLRLLNFLLQLWDLQTNKNDLSRLTWKKSSIQGSPHILHIGEKYCEDTVAVFSFLVRNKYHFYLTNTSKQKLAKPCCLVRYTTVSTVRFSSFIWSKTW